MKAMVVNDENAKDATLSMDLRSRVALLGAPLVRRLD
jgi:hypothetical protein